MSFSLIISVGPYGGFYLQNGTIMKQICIGWISFILLIPEWGDHLSLIMARQKFYRERIEELKRKEQVCR